MKNLILCLVGLALAFRVQGQNDYYSKPASKRITVYMGLNVQALSPVSKYAVSNVKKVGSHLQLGVIYNLPIWGKFSISPELAVRQNGAKLTYTTPLQYTYEYQVRGFSTQILLPTKYTFQIGRANTIGVAGGLFVELPINIRITEDLIYWNPNNLMDRLPVNNSAIHGLAKGWQIAVEYTTIPFKMRLYMADRGVLGKDIINVPSTRITGFTFGLSF